MNIWQQRLQEAEKTGRLWIYGEMEFPINRGADEAYRIACDIAEQCGYLGGWQNRSHQAFSICGGDIVGYVVCDWSDGQTIRKVEEWTAVTAWMQEVDATCKT